MNTLFLLLKNSFVIIGTIIGAGFISGREVLSFFQFADMRVVIPVIFVLFSTFFFIALSLQNQEKFFVCKIFKPVLLLENLIIFSGMLSAIDEVLCVIFGINFKIPIVSVFASIFSVYTVKNGIEKVGQVNFVLVPFILAITFVALIQTEGFQIEKNFNFSIVKLCSYVGMNVFVSNNVFADLGKKLSVFERAFTAIISAGALAILVFLMHSKLVAQNFLITNSSMPVLQVLKRSKVAITLFSIISILGIITTLISAHYPLFLWCKNTQKPKIANALLLVTAFAISRFGFKTIIDKLYPILGIIGFFYLIIISILSFSFRKAQRQNT